MRKDKLVKDYGGFQSILRGRSEVGSALYTLESKRERE